MILTETTDTFLADFGVAVVFGAVSGLGILDMPDTIVGDGISVSADYTLLVKASVFGALKFGDAITVGGVAYTVKEFRLADDGIFGRASLSKT
jgi:hypothetical protein